MTNEGKPQSLEQEELAKLMKTVCSTSFGVLDSNFLCANISSIRISEPPSVFENDRMADVIERIKSDRSGCVTVVNKKKELVGIFTERDLCLKIAGHEGDHLDKPVKDYMTANPTSETPDGTIAYALNLMSHGGFRHIPITDSDSQIIGVLSVKNVVDFIVESLMNDLMNFELEE